MATSRSKVPSARSAGGGREASGTKAANGTEAAVGTQVTGAAKGTKAAKTKAPAGKTRASGASAVEKASVKRAEKPSSAAATNPVAGQDAPIPAKLKQKLVRDSFTMPKQDFALIELLKERMVVHRRPTKKSELLRAGLHALMTLSDTRLGAALDELAPLKAGRPRKTS